MLFEWIVRKYHKKKRRLVKKLLQLIYGKDWDSTVTIAKLFGDELPLAAYASGSRQIVDLTESVPFFSEEPRRFGTDTQHVVGTFSAIAAREFLRVTVHPEASAIVSKDKILVPPFYVVRPDALIVDSHLLVSQKDGIGIVRRAYIAKHNEGISVFGNGSLNWYHWLIEILPAAFLAKRLPAHLQSLPLLVPEPCMLKDSFRESLNLFADGRKIVPLPVRSLSRIDRLILIDSPVIGPMNMSSGRWPAVTDYSQNAEVLLQYRSAMLDRLGITAGNARRRIFLARANDRRSFNQGDLADVAVRHGFEVVQPERMSFRDQAVLFSEASVLLGASGAAFANMIFCQPGTRSLTWILPQYGQFCAYSNLAHLLDIKLRYLFVTPTIEVRTSFDAYEASYLVDKDAFEENLIALLAEGQ
jgi:hypothetical protein